MSVTEVRHVPHMINESVITQSIAKATIVMTKPALADVSMTESKSAAMNVLGGVSAAFHFLAYAETKPIKSPRRMMPA